MAMDMRTLTFARLREQYHLASYGFYFEGLRSFYFHGRHLRLDCGKDGHRSGLVHNLQSLFDRNCPVET
jgi:hypothetical protein